VALGADFAAVDCQQRENQQGASHRPVSGFMKENCLGRVSLYRAAIAEQANAENGVSGENLSVGFL
jgi:hypothetical protein